MLLLVAPIVVSACSCVMWGPPCEETWKASAVFVGRVTDINVEETEVSRNNSMRMTERRRRVIMTVEEGFIGMDQRSREVEVRTGMGGGDCGYPFRPGESYVVYAYEGEKEKLYASICSRTAPVVNAQADLDYLRRIKDGNPSTYLFGMVHNGAVRPEFDQERNRTIWQGLSGVTVTLSGTGKDRVLTTREDGEFQFENLEPGKYKVSVSKPNYAERTFANREFEVHKGGCAEVQVNMVLDHHETGK